MKGFFFDQKLKFTFAKGLIEFTQNRHHTSLVDFFFKTGQSSRMNLSAKDKKNLRGHAQTLRASMTIGKSGITQGVLETIDIGLKKNELIKIRFSNNETTIEEQCAAIVGHTGAVMIGIVGKTAALYKACAK